MTTDAHHGETDEPKGDIYARMNYREYPVTIFRDKHGRMEGVNLDGETRENLLTFAKHIRESSHAIAHDLFPGRCYNWGCQPVADWLHTWAKYAEFKAAGMLQREKGDIIEATRFEQRAERVYQDEMPGWMKW